MDNGCRREAFQDTSFIGRGWGSITVSRKTSPDVETGPLKQPDGNLEDNL
jgi:hypothetical protein